MKDPANKKRLAVSAVLWAVYLFCMFLSVCGACGWLPGAVGMFGLTGYMWARIAVAVYAVSMFTSYYMFPKIAQADRSAKTCWYLPLIAAIVLTFFHLYLLNVESRGPLYSAFTVVILVAVIVACTALMNKLRFLELDDKADDKAKK